MVSLAHEPELNAPPPRWRARWNAFRRPIAEEKTRVLKERWESLPLELRTNNQISGRHLTHCGFTLGASYCSFHCTHCYLPKNANEIPIPSLAQVKEQIDANRRLQGPGGGLQITGGDVADAYWKSGRGDELIEIVRYAISVGSIPMLMTHGQTLIEHPEFLERLMVEGGLRQISVHVDMTQAGRHGFPIGRIKCEADLHPVRQAFTDLALGIREKTGLLLEYALSFTVTRRNIDDVPEVIRWYLADPQRSYVWRMLSFQPEADTGRTIFSQRPISFAGFVGKNLRRRWPAAATRRFHFRSSRLQQLGVASCRPAFGKNLSSSAGREEVRFTARRSAAENRRPLPRQRRCRDAALSARRRLVSASGSRRQTRLQDFALRHFAQGAAGNLPLTPAREGPHVRRRHAQFHGRKEGRASRDGSGGEGAAGFLRVQRRGETQRRMGGRANVLDEPANVVGSLRGPAERPRAAQTAAGF